MAEFDEVRDEAREALERASSLADAESTVPGRSGLYAIYGGARTWNELALGDPPDGRPLYVGKAEDSLVTRDLKTHFGAFKSISSTASSTNQAR